MMILIILGYIISALGIVLSIMTNRFKLKVVYFIIAIVNFLCSTFLIFNT